MTERNIFVGRERELRQLDGFLKLALASQGQVCFVTGEAGSGKTALVAEFAHQAQEREKKLLVAAGQSDAQTGIGDPYLPFREALAMLTGDASVQHPARRIGPENAHRLRAGMARSVEVLVEVAPELVGVLVPGGKLLGEVGKAVVEKVGWMDKLESLAKKRAALSVEQSRIFEQYTAYLQRLSTKTPLILILDDLQWSDAASLELLFHLGRRIGESRVLIVGAYRPEEVALGRGGQRHPLEKVVAELMHYVGDIWVDLDEVEEAERREFVEAFLETEPNRLGEEFREALFGHTAGQALFTVELLQDMQERGDIVKDEEGRMIESPTLDWEAVPARVEGVIEERIGRLEEEPREMLSVASVEGQDFTAQVVGRVQEMGERQLLQELSQELERRHRLVQEQGESEVGRHTLSRYRFAHALFQRYLYGDLSAGQRRVLHREVGKVLEELYEGSTEEIDVQLARHFELAGMKDKAIEYLLRVGDRARGLYAHQEAIDHYQRALGLLKERGEYERAARTLMKLGLTYHNAFHFGKARQAYEEGFALWQRIGEVQPAAVLSPAPHALRVALNDFSTVDPGLAPDYDSGTVIMQLFSGLVELGPDMGVAPDVARSWEILEGGRKYIFHLRNDVRWSDGVLVTAGDFEYAWKRVLAPGSGSILPNLALLYDVRGAKAYHQGELVDGEEIGVRALDEFTLEVELEGSMGYFPQVLNHTVIYPVPRHVVQAHGDAWVEAGNIVTNGPFRLAARQRDEAIILERNPHPHGSFAGNLERVEVSVLSRQTAKELQMYEDDNLDISILNGLPLPEMDRARHQHAGEYVSVPALFTTYVGFNVSLAPFDDLRVRRAFVLGTDRETLSHVSLGGYYLPATGGLVPPGMPGHSPGIGLPYDPKSARQLLAEAGYPGGRGFPEVVCLGAVRQPKAQYLGAQWRENLGVEIRIEPVTVSEYFDRLNGRPPQMWIVGYVADYPDPDTFFRGSEWKVNTRWQNKSYDELLEGARRITDQSARMKIYQQADKMLMKEAVIMPLFHPRWHLLVKPWVRRYPTSPLRQSFWKDVIIEPH